eukprot:XP_001709696.1 Hypothetical protein GL50803_102340 [Giardia lamblia ATCC 50803]
MLSICIVWLLLEPDLLLISEVEGVIYADWEDICSKERGRKSFREAKHGCCLNVFFGTELTEGEGHRKEGHVNLAPQTSLYVTAAIPQGLEPCRQCLDGFSN